MGIVPPPDVRALVMKVKLSLTRLDFEDLHQRVDKLRAGTPDANVPKRALIDLLEDHGKLIRALEEVHIEVEEVDI